MVRIADVEELRISESVPIELKRIAIAVADELDYARTAEKLNTTSCEFCGSRLMHSKPTLFLHLQAETEESGVDGRGSIPHQSRCGSIGYDRR